MGEPPFAVHFELLGGIVIANKELLRCLGKVCNELSSDVRPIAKSFFKEGERNPCVDAQTE
jgi:hypothetical protein